MMRKQNAIGMMVGLAIGDAMGSALEFMPMRDRGNFITDYQKSPTFPIAAGQWTDDTSMALALADSIIENDGEWTPLAAMQNFLDWYQAGRFSAIDHCFDIGNTCRTSIENWMLDPANPFQGSTDSNTSGNGALMRMAPVIISSCTLQEARLRAEEQTLLTHGSSECIKYSRAFAYELFYYRYAPTVEVDFKIPREHVRPTGYVKDSYEAAWWAVKNGKDFESAIIKAINLGGDADTIGAIAGQLAGALYGADNIPDWMKNGLYEYKMIEDTAIKLFNIARKRQKNEREIRKQQLG